MSRQLKDLKTRNIIRLTTNRFIMVPDLDSLAQAAGQGDWVADSAWAIVMQVA